MGIRFEELKNGGYYVYESVTETAIGKCSTFNEYVRLMENQFLEPLDNVKKEDLIELFPDDKNEIEKYGDE